MKALHYLFILLAIGIFLLYSCSNDSITDLKKSPAISIEIDLEDREFRSDSEKHFFSTESKLTHLSTRSKVSNFVLEINNYLFELNQEDEFVSQISEQIGDPDWSNTIESTDESLWLPLIKNKVVSGLFGFTVIDNKLYFKVFKKSFFDKMSNGIISDNIEVPLSLMEYFSTGEFNYISEQLELRGCPPPPCGYYGGVDQNGYHWERCFCSGSPTSPGCCLTGGNSGGELDGGAVEAGGYSIEQWIELITNWVNQANTEQSTNLTRGGGGDSERVKLIRNLSNEQFVFDWLVNYLNLQIGESNGQVQYWQILAGNPHVSNPIYLYLNNYYDNEIDESLVRSLLDLLISYDIVLTQGEIKYLLVDNPNLISELIVFFNNHSQDPLAIQTASLHIDLSMQYGDYESARVNLDDFVTDRGIEAYNATAELFISFETEFGSLWIGNGEWNFMKQCMKSILPDLLIDLIPGSSVIQIIEGFATGNKWDVATGIVDLIIDLCPTCKIVKATEKVGSGMGKVFTIVSKWRFLRNIDAGLINKMPLHWRVKLSDDGRGVRWINKNAGNDHIRVSNGDPSLPWPSQQQPYIKRHKGNSFVDKDGNNVLENSAEAHIPFSDYTDFNFN